ncbi:MAG: 1-phosphofructokinase family hexose kinase [Spirochaetaceae bacterium]|jgi:1-phosphofructokinase|nr:1-phosphofructokinase family hexose kinase [Spirochaetaceae bacterium]
MKIVTFTLNPAIDLTIKLEKLVPGEVHRAKTSSTRAGGKGINVSTNIAGYGIDNAASGFLGSGNAEIFERHFLDMNISDGFVRVEGTNRTNIKIVDTAGTTDVNLNGFSVSKQNLEKLLSQVDAFFSGANGIAVLSGSLPSGSPPDFYGPLVKKLKSLGCTVFLDADGTALESALSAGILPDCIKPNIKEISEWAERPLEKYEDIIAVARYLLERGLKLVVVSMGSDGALFINQTQTIHAWGRTECIASTVGAGDAMMAGIVSAWAVDPTGCNVQSVQLEHIAKIATAFAITWLENSACTEPFIKDKGEFRKRIESAAHKVTLERI